MVKFFSSAVMWIIVLLLAIIALVLGIILGWCSPSGSGPAPSPGSSTSATPTSTAPVTPFVSRPVTTGPHVPAASPLTESVLAASGSAWFMAIDDMSAIDTSVTPHTTTPGARLLYLISPSGDRYEVANLDSLGFSGPDLVAWDPARGKVLLSEDRAQLEVLDLATGAVTSSWTFCDNPGGIRSGQAKAGNWLVRGGCDGTGIDGIYTDAGVHVPSGIVGATDLVTVVDVGDVQVLSEFETPPDSRFIAHYADGTTAAIPSSMAGDCYMLGKGRGQTLAIYCYSDTGHLSIWEMPVDLSAGHIAVNSAALEAFAASEGGYGPSDFTVTGYWSDSALDIIQFSLGDAKRLGVLYGGTVEPVGQVPFIYRQCYAVLGTAALVGGDGHLWWVDFDSGTDVVLLPGESAGSPIQVVGSDGYTALRQP